MAKRQEVFGLAPFPPDWVIPAGRDAKFGTQNLRLRSAPLGVLKTREQAEKLLAILKDRFPNRPLEIDLIENESAVELRFYPAG